MITIFIIILVIVMYIASIGKVEWELLKILRKKENRSWSFLELLGYLFWTLGSLFIGVLLGYLSI